MAGSCRAILDNSTDRGDEANLRDKNTPLGLGFRPFCCGNGIMASIGDVAKRAGVSLGTASRAINGNPAVSPQLRERVLAAAAELDYRPNALARALRSSRTHSLGLIVPDVTNPFFGE